MRNRSAAQEFGMAMSRSRGGGTHHTLVDVDGTALSREVAQVTVGTEQEVFGENMRTCSVYICLRLTGRVENKGVSVKTMFCLV